MPKLGRTVGEPRVQTSRAELIGKARPKEEGPSSPVWEIDGKRQGYEVPRDRNGIVLEESVECPLCKREVATIEAYWVGGTYIRYVICELCPFWREL